MEIKSIDSIEFTGTAWDLEMVFSNSLIIHKERTNTVTNKITTVTVVWKYRKILRTLSLNFSKNYCSFEKLTQKLHSVFYSISRHLEVGLKKLGCASFFNPLLGVWVSDETLRVVLDMLQKKGQLR